MSKNENQPDDNKVAIGRKIFNQIKYHLELNGQSMAVDKFPPDFPISRRSCYHIARVGFDNPADKIAYWGFVTGYILVAIEVQ